MYGKESLIYVVCCNTIIENEYNEISNEKTNYSEKIVKVLHRLGCVGVTNIHPYSIKLRTYYFENEDKKLQFLLEHT